MSAMATWMAYAVIMSAALSVAALLAERGLEFRRRPCRWLWLVVMLASASCPFVLPPLFRPGSGPVTQGTEASELLTLSPAADLTLAEHGGRDTLLLGGWLLAASLILVLLMLSAKTLKQDQRRWRSGVVAGEVVAVSGWLGPAVVGAVRPCIVVPRWVLDLDNGIQRLIVLHEREHVRAGDSRLLLGGLLVILLLPWCLPLWWQYHRLRLAVETDCDRRLLESGIHARDYAHALLTVAQRRRRVLLPLAAMSTTKAVLERRIRLMAVAGPRRDGRLAVALRAGAAIMIAGAASVPLPRPPVLSSFAPLVRWSPNTNSAQYGSPFPDGSLPGDPGEARRRAEITRHHAASIARGLPAGSVIWFIQHGNGDVARTGIERGSESSVIARLRALYPEETSDYSLSWSDVPVETGTVRVIWMLPPRAAGVSRVDGISGP